MIQREWRFLYATISAILTIRFNCLGRNTWELQRFLITLLYFFFITNPKVFTSHVSWSNTTKPPATSIITLTILLSSLITRTSTSCTWNCSYCDFQFACLKQNSHVNKVTNQGCHINAVAISLANFIMWVFVFADNQPEKDSILKGKLYS